MKFRCIEGDEGLLTSGNLYHGTIILKTETRENVQPATRYEIRIIVFNDRGDWRDYSASRFQPTEE